MPRPAYYNEKDKYAAQWLRNLIAAGLVPAGDVDERSIEDVSPDDVAGYGQCHFFAGIGGWALAARLAGWPDDRELWTGSCPCQPYSVAGKGAGNDDERHLWPHMFRLIDARRPAVWFGEQVAAAAKPRDAREEMQRVRRAQALQRVLRGQQGPHADELLRMLEGFGASSEGWYDRAAIGVPCGVEEEESSARTYRGSEASRFAEGLGVRSGSVDPSTGGTIRARGLRDDRLTAEHNGRADMGQPFARQDRSDGGLHDNERPRGPVCAERDDEHVGRGKGSGGCGRAEVEDAGGGSASTCGLGSESEAQAKSSWLDGVLSDLESIGYACRAVVVPACAVDAPHRRDRLWIVADARFERGETGLSRPITRDEGLARISNDSGHKGALAHADQLGPFPQRQQRGGQLCGSCRDPGARTGLLADADSFFGGQGRALDGRRDQGSIQVARSGSGGGDGGSAWAGAGWIIGHDGKARRVEPSIRLLAHGVSGRMAVMRPGFEGQPEAPEALHWYSRSGALKGFGNAIVPQVAAEVIGAYLDHVRRTERSAA